MGLPLPETGFSVCGCPAGYPAQPHPEPGADAVPGHAGDSCCCWQRNTAAGLRSAAGCRAGSGGCHADWRGCQPFMVSGTRRSFSIDSGRTSISIGARGAAKHPAARSPAGSLVDQRPRLPDGSPDNQPDGSRTSIACQCHRPVRRYDACFR